MVGYLGRLGEGFQARAHAARALKVPHVTRWRYVTERVNPVWAINWTHVTQTTVLFLPLWFLVLGCNCDLRYLFDRYNRYAISLPKWIHASTNLRGQYTPLKYIEKNVTCPRRKDGIG